MASLADCGSERLFRRAHRGQVVKTSSSRNKMILRSSRPYQHSIGNKKHCKIVFRYSLLGLTRSCPRAHPEVNKRNVSIFELLDGLDEVRLQLLQHSNKFPMTPTEVQCSSRFGRPKMLLVSMDLAMVCSTAGPRRSDYRSQRQTQQCTALHFKTYKTNQHRG